MKSLSRILMTACLVALLGNSFAAGDEAKSIMVEHTWARVILHDRPAAGYMSIHNMGGEADRIVSASSPMAERVELHTHLMEGSVMKMRKVDAVDVPAKGHVEFAPGGFHLMLFGLKHHAKEGDKIPVTVVFEKAGPMELELEVRKSAEESEHGDHSGHSD